MTAAGQVSRSENPVLAATALGHKYGEFIALASLDLEVRSGEMLAMVGPNGAGKTTFLTMAAGLLEPSSGAVQVAGSPAGSLGARTATSYIPDTPVFYDDLSLNEHLEYIARLHGVAEWAPRASDLLMRLGLEQWGESLPSDFSRGMRQKASIALGLIRPFTLLLADEPFDGLDPASRDVLFELLGETCGAGAAAVITTHRTEVIDAANRCVALYDGALTYDGAADASAVGRHLQEPGDSL
jgi:ABC-2 type transport system ATP-binding protein